MSFTAKSHKALIPTIPMVTFANQRLSDDENQEWNKTKHSIVHAANEALGKKKRLGKRNGARIWNEEIHSAIKV